MSTQNDKVISNNVETNAPPTTKDRSILFVILVSCAAAFGGLLYGYDSSVISGAIDFIQKQYQFGDIMKGWVVSSILVGGAIGVLISGPLADVIGRKKVLCISALVFAVPSLFIFFIHSVFFLVLCRLIGGVGIGIAATLSVTYITEIAPPHIRGSLATIYQFAIGIGITAAYFVNAGITSSGDTSWNISTGWHYMLGIGALPAFLYLLFLIPVPESPRWLIKKKRKEEAYSVLKKVNGERIAQIELNAIESSMNQTQNGNWRTLFKPGYRKVFGIGVFLAVFQQLVGVNAVIYYAPEVFIKAGHIQNLGFTLTVLIGTFGTLGVLCSMWLVDKLGRRALMITGTTIMSIILLLIGCGFYFNLPGYTTIFFILLFIFAFNASLGPVVWVILSEIFPNQVRGVAMSLATFFMWVTNWVVSTMFPSMMTKLGGAFSFWIFMIAGIITLIFIWKNLPETKGKTLEQIEQLWVKN